MTTEKEKDLQELDYEWFLANYDNLFKEYGVSYLAIKDKKVLGKYASYVEAITETEKTEPAGSFIVQFCDGNKTGYTNHITSMFILGA